MVSSGVRPWARGVSALSVESIRRPEPSATSHTQPEPNFEQAAAVNSARKASAEPKSRLMAAASGPPGSPPPSGLIECQWKSWFQAWAALSNSAPGPAEAAISAAVEFS